MSVEQILKELPKLTPEERREIFELLAELETQHTYRPTPEESAAIDEAIRSLEAGKGVPAVEIRQRFAAKWSRSSTLRRRTVKLAWHVAPMP